MSFKKKENLQAESREVKNYKAEIESGYLFLYVTGNDIIQLMSDRGRSNHSWKLNNILPTINSSITIKLLLTGSSNHGKKTFKILVNLSTQVMNIKNVLRRSNHKKQFKIYKNDYLIYINYLRCSDHTRQFKS